MKYLANLSFCGQKSALIFVYLAIFSLLFWLNQLTPLWGDDWWRALNTDNFIGIFSRIHDEYMQWTGRASVLFLTYLGLLKYPGSGWVFSLANSTVFVLLIQGLFMAATGKKPQGKAEDIGTLIVAFFAVWFCTQSFGEAVLWKTGAVAYLWVITASIYLLMPYVQLLAYQKIPPNSWAKLTLLPLVALFLAISLENVAAAITAFMLYALIAAKVVKLKLPAWFYLTFVAYVIGTLALLSAPGNFKRIEIQHDGVPMVRRFGDLLEVVWQHGAMETLSFTVIAVLLILVALQKKVTSSNLKNLKLWFIIALMFALAMIGSTGVNFGDRTAFAADIGFIVVIVGLSYQLLKHAKPFIIWAVPSLVLLLLLLLADIWVTIEQYQAMAQQHQRRLDLMQEYQANGVKRILLPSMQVPYVDGLFDDIVEKRFFLRDIHGDTPGNDWRNGSYADYYGFSFAIRLNKPYLIYLPELTSSRSTFRRIAQGDNWVLLRKEEARGFGQIPSLYLISPKSDCLNAVAATFSSQAKAQQWTTGNNVAMVSQAGTESDSYCVIKKELTSNELNADVITLDLTSKKESLALDLSAHLSIDTPWPNFLNLQSQVWPACRLATSENSLINQQDCSVENKPAANNGFITFGPYYEVKPGRYRAELELMSGAGNYWDISLQYNQVQQLVANWVIPDTKGKAQVVAYEFEVAKDLPPPIKLEVRAGYGGQSNLKVFNLTLTPLN